MVGTHINPRPKRAMKFTVAGVATSRRSAVRSWPANPVAVPVGLSVQQPGGGRFAALGAPLPVLSTGDNSGVSAFVTNVLRHLGLDR